MVQIEEVLTQSQLKKFVDYPNRLYKNVPAYVPGTFSDDLEDWSREKIPHSNLVMPNAGWQNVTAESSDASEP